MLDHVVPLRTDESSDVSAIETFFNAEAHLEELELERSEGRLPNNIIILMCDS